MVTQGGRRGSQGRRGGARVQTATTNSCELQSNPALKQRLNARADEMASEFPAGVARPALRALDRIGVSRLDQLTGFTEQQIGALHGMGPKALTALRAALRARGRSFRK